MAVENLVVRNATVDAGTQSWTGVRLTIGDGLVRVHDHRGQLLKSGTAVGVETPSARLWQVEVEGDGIWTVKRKGCNCGKR